MKAKSINLSADLTEALKAQAPYSKRGRTLAQNAISMLDTTVSNVSYELQSEIDRLYYKNFRNDETTAKLSSQLTKIRSDYSILPQKMREDVDSISRNDFSIERDSIKIQKIKEKPRIAHIPALETVDPDTKVRIRMAQQLTGLLIMK